MAVTVRPALVVSTIVWTLITCMGVYLLLHTGKFINFGIDLVGGTYITLEVDTKKALENELVEHMHNVSKVLQQEGKEAPISQKVEETTGLLTFTTPDAAQTAYQTLMLNPDPRMTLQQESAVVKIKFTPQAVRKLQEEAIEGNINVLRTRLDTYGVGEITIAAQGDKNIIIELPNVDNPEEAKQRIGRTALLEMKPVYDSAATKEQLLERQGGQLPEGTMIVPGKAGSGEKGEAYYLVPTYSDISGRQLKDASYALRRDDFYIKGTPHTVNFILKPDAEEKFYELTSRNVGGRIAILIDNIVVSAPRVSEPIRSTSVQISGNFAKEEAKELAALLKSGAFIAPVKYVEERHIGPSLGKESIQKGLFACLIALGLLLAFSVIVYKIAGIFAFIVLLYNLVLILFGLATLGATLTLPGIAGMVLTVGMAIDSSILIYERIKEELKSGATMRNAVSAGFAGATGVILDANITTFIVSIVLYWLGTGPIQGFASTMMIGIISTLITGLLLLRYLFNISFEIFKVNRIKI